MYFNRLFICGSTGGAYTSPLAIIVQHDSELADSAVDTQRLANIAFSLPYGMLHVLTNFEYWLEGMVLEMQIQAQHRSTLFSNWPSVDNVFIQTHDRGLIMRIAFYWLRPRLWFLSYHSHFFAS